MLGGDIDPKMPSIRGRIKINSGGNAGGGFFSPSFKSPLVITPVDSLINQDYGVAPAFSTSLNAYFDNNTLTLHASFVGNIVGNATTATDTVTKTGTGSTYATNTSPTFITPVLGTPTSGTLTNCTGYTEANLSTSDITTNNVSTSKHGFAPKAPNDATKYLDGTGAYSVPASGSGTVNSGTAGQVAYYATSTTAVSGGSLLNIAGITNAATPGAGKIGELKSSQRLFTNAINLTNNAANDVTSIALTAGMWYVWGNVYYNSGTNNSVYIAWTSTTSATLPDQSLRAGEIFTAGAIQQKGMVTLPQIVNTSGTPTVYLSCYCSNTAGTTTGCGALYALRIG